MSGEIPSRMEPESIKQAIDLVDFAQRYTQLTQISRAGEYAGPCPRCGGEDRFHVKGQRFYCRQCYPRGGDVIDLVQILHNLDFRAACHLLSTEPSFSSEQAQPPTSPAGLPRDQNRTLQPTEFAERAARTLYATQRLLHQPEGVDGRRYLEARGLQRDTWRAFRLGFGQRQHPQRHHNEPAIFIPWYASNGSRIEAVRCRFIGPELAHGERYALLAGSQPQLFGLHTLRPADQIVLVEGEFNCMALYQAGVVALSIGSATSAQHAATLARLHVVLTPYKQFNIWLDEPDQGKQLATQLGISAPFREKDMRILSHGQDANDLLKAQALLPFLAEQGIVS